MPEHIFRLFRTGQAGNISGMGYYLTDPAAALCECREKTHPPSKKRVWKIFSTSRFRTGKTASQLVESHREKQPTPTKTASGVLYYGYRYYSPSLGRWLSRDPIGEMGGLNLYGYVDNDVMNYVDTDGMAKYQPNGGGAFRSGGRGGINAPPDKVESPKSPNDPYGRDGTSYGHYCGSGTRPPGYTGEPIDSVDGACKNHDKCYADNKVPSWNSRPSKTCGKRKCDTDLVNGLASAMQSPLSSQEARRYAEDAIFLFRNLGACNPPSQWEKCYCKEYGPVLGAPK